MRALLFEGVGKLRMTDRLELIDPADDEVVVRIVASGLCHSDVSVVNGTIAWPSPAILGHEGAGVVERVGAGVTSLAVGDHVVLHTLASCGHCAHCGSGRPTHCRSSLGNRAQPFRLDGAPVNNFAGTSTFTEKTIVKAWQAVRIDPAIPLDVACLIGCGVLTGVGAVLNRAKVATGDRAAVFGIGGVGLNVIQGLQLAGADRIIAVDLLPQREEVARAFGATDFIDASAGDVAGRIRALLPEPGAFESGGVDWSFECSGNVRALADAVAALNWGGNCVVVGTPPADTKIDLPVNMFAQVDRGVMGVRYGSAQPHRDVPMMIDLYDRGRLKLDELVSQRYRLEDFEDAIHDLEAGKLARGVFVME